MINQVRGSLSISREAEPSKIKAVAESILRLLYHDYVRMNGPIHLILKPDSMELGYGNITLVKLVEMVKNSL